MSAKINYDESEIRFDIEKEARTSVEDSRSLICIDIDKVGATYRAIINGTEFQLPPEIGCMADAKQIAIELAVKSVNEAIREIAE